jgi:hypothetical protein
MSKLWIIGDSFTTCGDKYWVNILAERFKGGSYHISSASSRDFQTILDIFLRKLNDISKDDFVILVVPFLGRTRLPLQTPRIDTSCSNMNNPFNYKDYFIGESSYTRGVEQNRLEEPLMDKPETEIFAESQLWTIVNSSLAAKENYIQILQSLKQYLPFQMYIFSWLDDIQCDIVETKSQITQGVGYWHTLWDVWKETNGVHGLEGNAHFSQTMHQGFADYLTNKFNEWFSIHSEEQL